MTDKKRRPARTRGRPRETTSTHKSPYFLQPAKQGMVTVFRRPAGNRIDPKLCGTMASRALALALVKQLEKAESVVRDLFLEATDDGIEALEAVLAACRQSVDDRGGGASTVSEGGSGGGGGGATTSGGGGRGRRGRGRRRGGPPRNAGPHAPRDGPAAGTTPDGSAGAAPNAGASGTSAA